MYQVAWATTSTYVINMDDLDFHCSSISDSLAIARPRQLASLATLLSSHDTYASSKPGSYWVYPLILISRSVLPSTYTQYSVIVPTPFLRVFGVAPQSSTHPLMTSLHMKPQLHKPTDGGVRHPESAHPSLMSVVHNIPSLQFAVS